MSTMEEGVDTGQPVQWTVVHNTQGGDDQVEVVNDESGPLLVAMQPGVDVPAVEIGEVVVVTEGTEVVEFQGVETDIGNASYMHVATVEEVVEAVPYGKGNVVEVGTFQEGDIARREYRIAAAETRVKGRLAVAKAPPPSSSSESESEDSSDQSDNGTGLKKKPKKREFAHRLQWRDRDMLEALKAVQEMKMTIRGAAKKFAVPYSTLKDRVHGRVRHGTKPGVKTALSPEEEEELVRYVKDMETAGFQLRYIDVRDRAGELLRLNHGYNTVYRDCSPGHNWLAGFLKRHPGLEFKRPSNRNCLPSMTKQKQMLRKFFEVAGQVFKKYKLHHKSDRIFCVSEIKLSCYQSATILVAMAADGTVLPPFVVFPGVRLKLTSVREAFPGAAFTSSYDGQINEDVFLWWFRDHFLKHVPSVGRKPNVLFLSRWVVDVTLQLAQKAKEEKVHLVCIPPGVAHLVLPLEDTIVHNLETMIAKKAIKWESENLGTAFTHRAFAQILHKVWRRAITSEHVTLKFAKNGLFPLNNLAISNERIFAAAQTMREIPRPPSPLHHGSPLSGLSLLSALSSHEYASLQQNSRVNLPDSLYENTPEQPRHKSYLEEQLVASPTLPSAVNTPINTRKRQLHEMLERSLLQQQLEGGTPEQQQQPQQQETDDKEVLAYKEVHSALVAARDNRDQINRAIDSILSGESVMTLPKAKKLRTISDSDVKPSWKIVRIETVAGEGNTSTEEQLTMEAPPEVVVHEEVIFDQIVSEETVVEETVQEEVVQEEPVQEIVQEEIVQEIVEEEIVQEEDIQEEHFETQPNAMVVHQDGSEQVCKTVGMGKPTTMTTTPGNWMSQFKEFIKIVPSPGSNAPASRDVKSKFMIKGGEVFLQPVEMMPHVGSEVAGGHVFVKGEVMEMAGEEQVVTSTDIATVDLAASGDAKQIPPGLVQLIHVMPNGEQVLVAPSLGESVVRRLSGDVSGAEQTVEMYTEDVVQQEMVVSSGNDLLAASQQGGGEPQTVVEECVVEYIQMLPDDTAWEEQVV